MRASSVPVTTTVDDREGPLPIADEFFLVAHGGSRGRARLNPTATGLGLAAALLGELILRGRFTVADGRVSVLDGPPPAGALAGGVLAHLLRGGGRAPWGPASAADACWCGVTQ